MKVTYKKYREKTPLRALIHYSIMGYIASVLSPFTSIICMRYNLRPNTITMFMIITGILAGAVLMLPSPSMKFISMLLYVLWFTFDSSDGEVARYTQTFSKGGKYLDWAAHLITHPLFMVSMWITLYQWMPERVIITTLVTFLFMSIELIGRNRIAMDTLYGNISNAPKQVNEESSKDSIAYYIYWNFVYFPNILLFIPLLTGLCMLWGWSWFYWIYIGWALFYSLVMLRVFVMFIWRMYKSE